MSEGNAAARSRVPVSIVCVFNDADVLSSCLEHSIRRGMAEAPSTQFIAVDNRDGRHPTAGAALNAGARDAINDVVVFVHQDVYLHSLPALERAAAELLTDERIGVMGAVGVDRKQAVVGRIRDRVMALGDPAPVARDIDSLDEVLFLVRRSQWALEPLADDRSLGWHAYAVEYCARMRATGRRAVARDIPLTHNSMTTNLARLDVAHRWVRDRYRALLPMQTTCGTIGDTRPSVTARRWRSARRWLAESIAARRLADAAGVDGVLIADIRFIVDDIADTAGADAVQVLDLGDAAGVLGDLDGLTRRGRPFRVRSVDAARLSREIVGVRADSLTVVTNLSVGALRTIASGTDGALTVGLSHAAGPWAAWGVRADGAGLGLTGRRHLPFAGLARPGRRPLRASAATDAR